MTLLPLTDPLWSRLYSAYGLRDIAGPLAVLAQEWDDAIARDLFWENLHHQEDIYPATYVALPWLWDIAQRQDSADVELLLFLSHTIFCASLGDGGRGALRGLSLDAHDHAHRWIDADHHLTQSDMTRLKPIAAWFMQHRDDIAEACLARGGVDIWEAVYLGEGRLALDGGFGVIEALGLFTGDHPFDTIIDECPPTPKQADIALQYAERVAAKHPDLAKFLTRWAGHAVAG